jgi:ATP-binding cassette subfamily G (WHITE) protein 2 (SNQ2)
MTLMALSSIFFLFVFIMTITMRGWFRMLASAFKSPAPAQTIAGLSTLALSIYTGPSLHLCSVLFSDWL